MMMLDPEILEGMVSEMNSLTHELGQIVAGLQKSPEQPALFERFGQVIDRVFGTAATLEMKELASYCGTLKKICYECAKVNNPRANARVLRLLESYLENVNNLIKSISDPDAAKRINFTIHLEEQKAKKIYEEIFKFIKK